MSATSIQSYTVENSLNNNVHGKVKMFNALALFHPMITLK